MMSSSDPSNSYAKRILTLQTPDAEQAVDALAPDRQVIETHISWVLLTGHWAYKFKKPVTFDFLDYSTPQLRRHYCELECLRNAPWSGDLYDGVAAVLETDKGLAVASGDYRTFPQAVDYAVKMKQFPQSALLQSCLQRQEMSLRQMEQLAAWLVRLQQGMSPVSTSADLLWQRLHHATLENFEFLESQVQSGERRAQIQKLHDWTKRQLELRRQDFHARVSQGKVVSGHGDLHLGNILYWHDAFLLFDAIEFNQSLYEIDTINEIAFLVMELSEHGYRDHSHRLRNQFAEVSGDYEGLRWLRFYNVYRALVRAKVDCISMSQRPDRTSQFSVTGQAYLDYAEGQIAERKRKLWITMGFSGSGKSYRAQQIVDRLGFLRLRSDVVRKQIFGLDPNRPSESRTWSELYSVDASRQTFANLLARARQLLQDGFDVIVDATFLRREHRQPFQSLARSEGAEYGIVACSAPVEELMRRIRHRTADPSDATPELLPQQMASWEPLGPDESPYLLPEDGI